MKNETVSAREVEIIEKDFDALVAVMRESMAVHLFEIKARLCESPIERLMLAALAYGLSSRLMFPNAMALPPFYDLGNDRLLITPQMQIGPHRVDFAIVAAQQWSGNDILKARVVIECDGHDFHERTKEQAERDKSRDRYLAIQGWTVLRFTGREVFRDPRACVGQIADLINATLSEQCELLNPEVFNGL